VGRIPLKTISLLFSIEEGEDNAGPLKISLKPLFLSESLFMEVNDALVENLCKLACLEFDAGGKQEIKKDLQNMIGFVEKLNELDLRDTEPLLYMGEEANVLRDDIPENPLNRSEALANAPYSDNTYFKVPQVVKNPASSSGS
jgi:aspartyl-tRNA(Asn)/glutamyl-tRNA(Gln) amidotransferase subunit C